MISRAIGNLCIGLAMLLYALPLPFLAGEPPGHDGSQGAAWGIIFTLIPLWFCLTVALCVSAANGGLDWLAVPRGTLYLLAAVTCLAMAVVTGLSGILRNETADQIPWAMRPLVPWAWAMWLFPILVSTFCLLTINPGLGAAIPRLVLRLPLGAAGGLSLLVAFGLLAQWFISSQQKQAARIDTIVSEQAERTQRQMEEVRGYDANTHLSFVLGYTNRYNDPKLRELALEKIRAVPDLEEQLATGLRGEWCLEVLVFLDASDPPDGKPLAEPAREAFTILADRARARTRNPELLYPDSFDFDVRLILSVADKFRGFGVDYAPAIRAYRGALDEPREQKIKFNAAAALSDWLARDAKRGK